MTVLRGRTVPRTGRGVDQPVVKKRTSSHPLEGERGGRVGDALGKPGLRRNPRVVSRYACETGDCVMRFRERAGDKEHRVSDRIGRGGCRSRANACTPRVETPFGGSDACRVPGWGTRRGSVRESRRAPSSGAMSTSSRVSDRAGTGRARPDHHAARRGFAFTDAAVLLAAIALAGALALPTLHAWRTDARLGPPPPAWLTCHEATRDRRLHAATPWPPPARTAAKHRSTCASPQPPPCHTPPRAEVFGRTCRQ